LDRLVPLHRERAVKMAQTLALVVAEIQAEGASSLREIAAGLNARGVPTPKGGHWSAMKVKRVWSGLLPEQG
jgi:hypothetical protein